MDLIDRSTIPGLHAAARHARAEHVHALFRSFRIWLAGLIHRRLSTRTAHWA